MTGRSTMARRCTARTPCTAAGVVPMLGAVAATDPAGLGLPATASGRDLDDKGLTVKIGKGPQAVWIVYRK